MRLAHRRRRPGLAGTPQSTAESVVRRPAVGLGPHPRTGRAGWHARANAVVVAYLAASVVAVPVHAVGAAPRWMVVHLLLLGAVTNAIVTWTGHFTATLLRVPGPSRRAAGWRLATLNAAVLGVLVGVGAGLPVLTVAAATVLTAVITAHLSALVRSARRGLGGRFTATVRFYWVAAGALLAGVAAGTALAVGVPAGWQARLYAAHVHLNLFGWVALAVLGTEFTLWPTVLRTRMVSGVQRAARRVLPACTAGLALTVAGLLTASRPVAAAGLVLYLAGVAVSLDPFVRTGRQRLPRSPAAWMLAAGTGWLLVALGVDLAAVLRSADAAGLADRMAGLVPWLLAGFVAQVLAGALTYLLPVVLGGGPASGRRAAALLDRWAAARTLGLNAGVAMVALPVPTPAAFAGWALITTALTVFVALTLATIATTRRRPLMNSDIPAANPPTDGATGPEVRASRRPLLGGLAIGAVMLLVAVAIAISGGRSASDQATVSVTGGGTQTVEVSLVEMDIVPRQITVTPGTRLVLEVTNDGSMRHDLAFPDGPATAMLDPGDSERLDLGTLTASRTGWCTVPGHKAAGMTLSISVTGSEHSHRESSDAAAVTIDPGATPDPGFRPADAVLPPAEENRVHRVTLRASDEPLAVAPGVTQRMWTFGGTVPGPTLRGRVGDTFVITLINDDEDMGHSIDFHASMLAPDGPMRTIEPGERLVYRFTATHAGAWMYHCATEPMIQHIGNGMYGAVIIDPPDLEPADAEYALVQSELYLGPQAEHGDFDAMARGTPDAVVFNGYYDQYRHQPLTARAGDRVRIWLVNAGLERPSAFHVVGTQFDTVWGDGAYLVRPGNAAHGAAQALGLQPGQGGFVEFTIPEPGHYPFLSHVMVDANRGAAGVLDATR